MQNKSLAQDYLRRAKARLLSIQVLMNEKSWADVVRESQEVVELALKGLLRSCNIMPPRIHDVSAILTEEIANLPKVLHKDVSQLGQISKNLRRDRELAFYGSEDLTPSDFYSIDDATKAYSDAQWLVKTIAPHIK